MIKSFKLPDNIQERAFMKLNAIDSAPAIEDLRLPLSNRLEKRRMQYSIRINERWRICFEWQDDNAEQVEITDYH